MSREQWALIQAGFLLLRKGGFLLYATCALTETENDAVIAKLLAAHPDAFYIDSSDPSEAAPECSIESCIEKTQFGCRILPDTANEAGPLYWALIGKRAD